MARKTFFSFHYVPDSWRVSQVRNAGVVEDNPAVSDNDWEAVTRAGDAAIERWIDEQMNGRSCSVVLIGNGTAGRKWINYEITKSWNDRKGLLGIYIHNLKNANGEQSNKGSNPFDRVSVGTTPLSNIVKVYDPPYTTSTYVYDHIKENLANWVEEAVTLRARY